MAASVDNLIRSFRRLQKYGGIDLCIRRRDHVEPCDRTSLQQYTQDDVSLDLFDELAQKKNGASKIANYLTDECTTVNLFVGKAVNANYSQKTCHSRSQHEKISSMRWKMYCELCIKM